MDKQAQASEPIESMFFSAETVMDSSFFKGVIGPRFDDQVDGIGLAEPIAETEDGSTGHTEKICSPCDVTLQCLEYVLDHDKQFGIWGGLSERERRKLRKVRTV